MLKFKKSVLIKTDIVKLFEFHRDTNNLTLISPKFVKTEIDNISEIPLQKGSVISLKLKIFIFSNNWVVSISQCNPPYLIKDLQIKGMFKFWHHSHIFGETKNGILMTDDIEFIPPFGILGYFSSPLIYFFLYLMFTYRHKKTKQLFEKHD
ncbi:MAG TPA: SRPBCC family protein [Melioribacteraceae bacterium]|nr:SRPBCC family protein [Melioribacteraceae bacterium]